MPNNLCCLIIFIIQTFCDVHRKWLDENFSCCVLLVTCVTWHDLGEGQKETRWPPRLQRASIGKKKNSFICSKIYTNRYHNAKHWHSLYYSGCKGKVNIKNLWRNKHKRKFQVISLSSFTYISLHLWLSCSQGSSILPWSSWAWMLQDSRSRSRPLTPTD